MATITIPRADGTRLRNIICSNFNLGNFSDLNKDKQAEVDAKVKQLYKDIIGIKSVGTTAAKSGVSIRAARKVVKINVSLVGNTDAKGVLGPVTPTVAATDSNGKIHGIPLDILKGVVNAIKANSIDLSNYKDWPVLNMRDRREEVKGIYAEKYAKKSSSGYEITL